MDRSAWIKYGTYVTPGTIIKDGGVTIEHYYHGSDHLPAHGHVKGEGPTVRIGANGKPLKGEPELSPQQKRVVKRNKSKIRSVLNKINRWFTRRNHGVRGCKGVMGEYVWVFMGIMLISVRQFLVIKKKLKPG
ncbi:hypothetical protein [Escherichia fergusonii]|uniref:hypothetical protein n=1 Tax=Escherichia fergusonii TaxID=564 RepID=UPI0022B2B97E|nr:hypothetical protein [Escherichia fergusonii]MCZ5215080.1 hypothetical protein [Escherichia fergusonii]